jgi:hypothetical protein
VKVQDTLLGIGALAFACAAAACQDSNASTLATTVDNTNGHHHHNRHTTRVTYDDFSNGATHSDRWMDVGSFLGIGEPEARTSLSIANGRMSFEATPFTTSFDNGLDHVKHLVLSTTAFDVPRDGWVRISADIDADTPGTTHNRLIQATGKRVKEGQQAAATLIMSDAGNSGARFMWWVSDNRALAIYERSPVDGSCDLNTSYTQILGEVNLRSRHNRNCRSPMHNFAIKYRRNLDRPNRDDFVDFMMDGHVRFRVRGAGVPEQGTRHHPITFPAQGPGEELMANLNAFNVGYGLASMVDVFPFNACSTGNVSVPEAQRIYGQGAKAIYDNFKIVTRDFDDHNHGDDDDDDD